MKTSELTGTALDWAVSHCVEWGRKFPIMPFKVLPYSTDWAQGGKIIEREGMSIGMVGSEWQAHLSEFGIWENGASPLIAAMRCYVASKLGDEVEMPTELQSTTDED